MDRSFPLALARFFGPLSAAYLTMAACEYAQILLALLLCGPILSEKIFDRFFEQSAQ
jgi:hypothetical protein